MIRLLLLAQGSEVVHSRKCTQRIVSNPVVMNTDAVNSSSETPTELDKNRKCTKSVGVPHAAILVVLPIQEAFNSNAIPVVSKKSRKRKVEQQIVENIQAVRTPLMVSGQISDMQQPKHPEVTLVPSTIIPSSSEQIEHSKSDGDSQMEAEEVAYHQELAKKQNELSKQKRVKPKCECVVSGVVMPTSSSGSQIGNQNEAICCTTLVGYKFESSVCGKKLKSEDRYREHFYSKHV